MKDFIKKYYLNILLVLFYTGIAMTVYIVWFDSMWHLWYVDFITAIIIFAIGCVLGYFYIKSEMKKNIKPEEKKEEVIENNTEEIAQNGDEVSGE